MKNKLIFSLVVFAFFHLLYAVPVDLPTARDVALTQAYVMNRRFAEANRLHSTFVLPEDPASLYDQSGQTRLAYVFELEPQGFVVVSADDDLPPVIAYGEHGSFPWEEHPENHLLYILREDLRLRLDALELMDDKVIQGHHDQWEGLIAGDPAYLDPGESWPEAGATWTGGWVESVWHQYSPYNDSCPIDPVTGERCVVGCVATAMAQIVNYWQYPESLIFTEEDNFVSDRNGRLIPIDAELASIPVIDYNDGTPEYNVCAAISYACGVGSRMGYTSTASGAWLQNTRISFLKHFNYIDAEYILTYDSLARDSIRFYTILEENMKDAKPAMISIGGHAIICDGIRETSEYNEWHLNFGWGQYSPPITEAWYKLPEGLPYGYTNVYYGILNIEPPSTSGTVEELSIISCSPNPFDEYVRVIFTVPQSRSLKVRLLDDAGRLVRILPALRCSESIYAVRWNGMNTDGQEVIPGIYFAYIESEGGSISQRIIYGKLPPPDSSSVPDTTSSFGRPNPFTDYVEFDFMLPPTEFLKVYVLDVAGRHVRNIVNEPLPSGQTTLQWDGNDDFGNSVSPGVYFIRVDSDYLDLVGKVELVR